MTKVPRLKGGHYTALQVLRFVRSLIAAEPKRLKMNSWLSVWRGKADDAYMDLPKCGTVACVGGWINIVTGHREGNIEQLYGKTPGVRALEHLGLNAGKPDVYGDYSNVPSGAARALDALFGQTHWSDKQVGRRLDQIIAKHQSELRHATAKVRAR